MSVGKVSPEPIAHNVEGYTKSGRRPDLVKHVPARRFFNPQNLRRVRA